MAKIDFGGVLEDVVTRDEFPLSKAREVLKDETVAVIGYGVQGPAQALNMRENGINVIIGQAPGFQADWNKAVADGFVPGRLFSMSMRLPQKGLSSSTSYRMQHRGSSGQSLNPALKRAMHSISHMVFR